MTKRELTDLMHQRNRLMALGISAEHTETLRRISMTLRRWFERECNGEVQRDEVTDKPYAYMGYRNGAYAAKYPVADRETGARKRLATLMAHYPTLTTYVQTDPRGCALYVLTAEHLAGVYPIESIYNRGVSVC